MAFSINLEMWYKICLYHIFFVYLPSMAKEKITHLFNKNHIEILKIENPQRPCGDIPVVETKYTEMNKYDMLSNWRQKPTTTVIEEKKASPLGFYYIKKTYKHVDKYSQARCQRCVYILTLKGDEKTDYQLKFYTQYDDNMVQNTEDGLRPWDICKGDRDFPDNMLNALVAECEKLFAIMGENKVKNVMHPKYGTLLDGPDRYTPINEFKRGLYSTLFGSPNGPRFQTNEEKILAHGFDLKTSFRKDKEKK